MSWHFSRALVAEFSEAICLAGEQSAPSSTTPTPEAYYWPDKTTEHSRLSRFGMTSEPLMEIPGEELLMWYRGASPARTYPQPAGAPDSTGRDPASGRKWPGLLAKYDRDSCSWRTAQCSLLADSDEFSETWPRWGSMRNGECWEREMSGLRISETGYGLWPTPTKFDAANARLMPKNGDTTVFDVFGKARKKLKDGRTASMGLSRLIIWMTGKFPRIAAYEGLMGWPIGWTELKPAETGRFRKWQQQHSASYQAESEMETA